MFHSNQDDYIRTKDIELNYILPHPNPNVSRRYSFYFCDLPPMGVGTRGDLFVDCDDYLDPKLLSLAYSEFIEKQGYVKNRFHHMIPFGLVPMEVNNQKCLDSYLINHELYDDVRNYLRQVTTLNDYHEVKNVVAKGLGLNIPWQEVIHFKKLKSFFEKNNPAQWNDFSNLFPMLIKLVESLPFKSIGYVMILRNRIDAKLDIHRDIFPRNHACHHMNIAFDQRPRKIFIYDSLTGKKYYKDPKIMSYFFNECDLHGADSSEWPSLTLRVDGIFKDNFAQEIGLISGVSFDWAFDKPQEFIKNHGPIHVWKNTDI